MYSLTLEVAQGATGMAIALELDPWKSFQHLNTAEFAATLVAITKHLEMSFGGTEPLLWKFKRAAKSPIQFVNFGR